MTVSMEKDEVNWIEVHQTPGSYGYDKSRYDPDNIHMDCLKCGTELRGVGDRATVSSHCPECEVMVFIS